MTHNDKSRDCKILNTWKYLLPCLIQVLGYDSTEEEEEEEELIAVFIMDVDKAIADWYKGIDVRKKLYKLFLNNSVDFIFTYRAWQSG